MKLQITLKDPDALYDAITESVEHAVSWVRLSDFEAELLIKQRRGEVAVLCRKWFRYGEILTVEVDTEAETCTVVPQ